MRLVHGLTALAVLLPFACVPAVGDPETTEDCIAVYSVEAGYGHDIHGLSDCDEAVPLDDDDDAADDDDDAGDCEPPGPEEIADEAEAEGHPFDPVEVITREAAECIADLDGFDEGIEGWYAWLVYHHEHQRPCWNLANVQHRDGPEAEGQGLTIDALTGEILDRTGWSVMP